MSGNLNPVLLQCFLIRIKTLITILSRNRWEPPARKTSETFGILVHFFKIFKLYSGLISKDSRQRQSFKGLRVNKRNFQRPLTKFVELRSCIIIESFSRATFIKAPQILLMKVYYRGGGGGRSPSILPWWVKHKPQLHCCSLSTLFPCSNTRRMFSLMTSVRL